MIIAIPVSLGELIDKLTILELKLGHLNVLDPAREHVQRELAQLTRCLATTGIDDIYLTVRRGRLTEVNAELWAVEDQLRVHEATKIFDETFIERARAVYQLNDRRAAFKREINTHFNSDLVEVKVLPTY